MKYNKTREDLTFAVAKYIPILIDDSKKVDEIAAHLSEKHGIDSGRLGYFLNDPSRLSEADTSELALISEQIYLKLEEAEELSISSWFNVNEIKEIRQYYYVNESNKDKIELPLTFENVIDLGNNTYLVAIDLTMIARMKKYGLLYYNSEIQREARVKKVGDKIREEANVIRKKVVEIKKRVLTGIQEKTTLAYNCAVYTTEHESEQELIYDEKENTLTITEGTRIDILDGMHRSAGIYEAYLENPNIIGKMPVLIGNMSTEQAKEYQVELAKATPISKARITALAERRYADELVKTLKYKGKLAGKISDDNIVYKNVNQLTTSFVLANAFDTNWRPEKRSVIPKIIEKFNTYLEYLFEEYEEFINDPDNLLFSKRFFAGHVVLAKLMDENNIPYENLNEILDNINFNKSNSLWKELKIYNDKKTIPENQAIKNIEKFFRELI